MSDFNILHHSQLDKIKWDKLVASDPSHYIYCFSYYLDATAIDWYVYVNQAYTCGIPFGTTLKLGVKGVYPPFFQQHVSAVGAQELLDLQDFFDQVKNNFSFGTLHFHTEKTLPVASAKFSNQILTSEDYQLKTLAKRSINKANKNGLTVKELNTSAKEISLFIINELKAKLNFYASHDAKKLVTLVENAHNQGQTLFLGIHDEQNQLQGAVIGLKFGNRLIYLKGACNQETKAKGGMYLLIDQLIHYSFKHQLIFDFGGSRIEEIMYFNKRFSAIDTYYHCITWDNSPWWFKLLRKMKGIFQRN